MLQKLDAVHIGENPSLAQFFRTAGDLGLQNRLGIVAGLVAVNQLVDVEGEAFFAVISQGFQHGLFDHLEVAVFAKHQGHHQPVVAGSDQAIGARVPLKSPIFKATDIGSLPVRFSFPDLIIVGVVDHIVSGDVAAPGDIAGGFADQYPVHDDLFSFLQVRLVEFVFQGDPFL